MYEREGAESSPEWGAVAAAAPGAPPVSAEEGEGRRGEEGGGWGTVVAMGSSSRSICSSSVHNSGARRGTIKQRVRERTARRKEGRKVIFSVCAVLALAASSCVLVREYNMTSTVDGRGVGEGESLRKEGGQKKERTLHTQLTLEQEKGGRHEAGMQSLLEMDNRFAASVGGGGGGGGGEERRPEASSRDEREEEARRLSGGGEALCEGINHSTALVALELVGILYIFLGLAVVCDEFFQTSLEKISEVLNLSPDVAGATFLAAGSSAPELFTSLADAFGDDSSIGVGTIVGSAMFNILVIVALSAAVAGKHGSYLHVDWRPVCRDVSFYSLSIVLMVIFFNDQVIQLYESTIMVLTYFLYVLFMKFNSKVLAKCTDTRISDFGPEDSTQEKEALKAAADGFREEAAASTAAATAEGGEGAATPAVTMKADKDAQSVGGDSTSTVGGKGAKVLPAPMDMEEGGVPAEADASAGSTELPPGRRKSMTLGVRNRVERRRSSLNAQGTLVHANGHGTTAGAAGKSGTGDSAEVAPLVHGDVNAANAADGGEAGGGGGGGDEALALQPVAEKAAAGPSSAEVSKEGGGGGGGGAGADEEAEQDDGSRFDFPEGLTDRILWVLGFPYLILFTITVPDCGNPRWENWYVVSFLMSIAWIGILCHYMVQWATFVACTWNIPVVVMGLVVLSVGTSVPDAIGSMIAAKSGEAGMAIANAVGSNVFDILLGLGLPWMLRVIILDKKAEVSSDGVFKYVVTLFCTVFFFLGVLVANKWRMNTTVGYGLFGLYLLFVVFSIIDVALS